MNTFDYNGTMYFLPNPIRVGKEGQEMKNLEGDELLQSQLFYVVDQIRQNDFEKALYNLFKNYKGIDADDIITLDLKVSAKKGGGFNMQRENFCPSED